MCAKFLVMGRGKRAMSNWYYVIDDEQHGPVGEEDIQRMVTTGELQPDDLLWQAGMPDWLEVSLVFPSLAGAPAGAEGILEPERAYSAPHEMAESVPWKEDKFEDDGTPHEASAQTFMPVTDRGEPRTTATPTVALDMRQVHPLALGSIILAIAGLVFCGLTSIPAVILGHMALSRIKREPERYGGQPLAVAGLVVGYFVVVLMVLGFLSILLSMS